ncbi:MAG TPA: amino acid ABC transporter substrate-binding protein [Pelomicrobium sp.]|nr:amino acid ABC transporter substrate-binding protein [Pelomicrobium sp.]
MKTLLLAASVALAALAAAPAQAGTLDQVKARGAVRCGVHPGLPGFAARDAAGQWRGFDVDFCRAVAAAVLGNANRVEFVPLDTQRRFPALAAGEVDVLSRNSTWTLQRDAAMGITFAGVSYFDGQGFLARRGEGLRSALQLDGARVCAIKGTTSIDNVTTYFQVNVMRASIVPVDNAKAALAAFEADKCNVITSDQSQLYALRTELAQPESAVVLPEIISKEPLGPAVREGDEPWFKIVRWTLNVLLAAEEHGVSSENVMRVREVALHPDLTHLFGKEDSYGKALGLPGDWALQIVRQVGNYQQVFERNLGGGSPLRISRGLNAIWKNGGLLYSPPIH